MSAVAVLFGRRGSTGLPGKNTRPLMGRPCYAWAIEAALGSRLGAHVWTSTDCPEIAAGARERGVPVITRPPHLATNDALLEDAILHAWVASGKPDMLAVLLANAPCVTPWAIDQALGMLECDPALDSAATASEMSAYAPSRARHRTEDGTLAPAHPDASATCDRGSVPPTWFCDQGVTVTRARVLQDMEAQPGPFRWQGSLVGLVPQPAGGADIDHPWQFAAAEYWLAEHAGVAT